MVYFRFLLGFIYCSTGKIIMRLKTKIILITQFCVNLKTIYIMTVSTNLLEIVTIGYTIFSIFGVYVQFAMLNTKTEMVKQFLEVLERLVNKSNPHHIVVWMIIWKKCIFLEINENGSSIFTQFEVTISRVSSVVTFVTIASGVTYGIQPFVSFLYAYLTGPVSHEFYASYSHDVYVLSQNI